MKLGILKEQTDNRVALTPKTVAKFKALVPDILLETGAGL